MNPKPIIIATCCAVAIVVGIYFVGQYTLKQNGPDDTLVPSTTEQKPGSTAKGHWHGNEWHEEPHPAQPANATTPANAGQDESNPQIIQPVTREEFNRRVDWDAYKADYRERYGIDPPPLNANWQHVWGEDGSVHRLYDGEAVITKYEMVRGFAPTKAQYERYQQLYQELRALKTSGPYAAQLSDEIDQILAESQGELPLKFSSVYLGNEGETGEAHDESARQAQLRAVQKLFKQFDLEHLVPYYFE